MAKNEILMVKDAVHKLQLSLLDGIKNENQLLVAGSLISKSDYQDVVTERTIAMVCGYPLCSNSLSSEKARKGRYRISLKEHKVYDVQESYMYCSTGCQINSQSFSAGLLEERSSNLNTSKISELLKHFDSFSMNSSVDMGKGGELGFSELKIKEKTNVEAGEVSLDEWIGPSNAIDGYVPRRDQSLKSQSRKPKKVETESRDADAKLDFASILSGDMGFTSVIITQDEYSISKTRPVKSGKPKGIVVAEDMHQGNHVHDSDAPVVNLKKARDRKPPMRKKVAKMDAKSCVLKDAAGSSQNDNPGNSGELHLRQESTSSAAVLKSSLRTSLSKKAARTVSWADEKTENDSQTPLDFCELQDNHVGVMSSSPTGVAKKAHNFSYTGSNEGTSQGGQGVVPGVSDAFKADGADFPPPHGVNIAKSVENGGTVLKWPQKQGFLNADLLDSDDSWYESPPDGFNLSLSTFGVIFNSLFTWISSSSLAYIYGKEDSAHEKYSNVNGREYPRKVVLEDGRSSEIKQTLAGYLSRALPGVVAELGLPVPISTLEQGMGRLLDTMVFLDPLPSLRMKQWQVIALLFLNALSVSRIPALATHMMGRRHLELKLLEGAKISLEQFEIMEDLVVPVGRVGRAENSGQERGVIGKQENGGAATAAPVKPRPKLYKKCVV